MSRVPRTLFYVMPLALLAGAAAMPLPAVAAPARGDVQIVQAMPGVKVDVTVDGKSLARSVPARKIVGPLKLSAGSHEVSFVDKRAGTRMEATVTVRAGESRDVVLHRPASPAGKAVVNVYRVPAAPIGPGKARVLVAHTALVPPADVNADGRTIFANIANGEFATAEVPAGRHQVSLTLTGRKSSPFLGPLGVSLRGGTVTMIYAVGAPEDGSMDVVIHGFDLKSDGSTAPLDIPTGSAGLVADQRVRTFAAPTASSTPLRPEPEGGAVGWMFGGAMFVLSAIVICTAGRDRGRRTAR